MKRMRPGQVDVRFLTACVSVLGLAFLGVLLMGLRGDSPNGLLLGMSLLLLAAVGGLGLAWYALVRGSRDGFGLREKSAEELQAELRRTPGPLVFGVIGAALGVIGSPFLLLPTFQRVLLGVLDGPILWIASIGVGALVGAAAGALLWVVSRPR